jgi:diguanylate cyclase (GGDEF)-like protein
LVAGGVLAAAFLAAPAGLGKDLVWQVLCVASFLGILVGVRRHRPSNARPWHVAAVGIGLFAAGSVFDAAAWGHEPGSVVLLAVSVVFVVAYLCIGAASALFVRALLPDGDREGIIDGAIVMTAAAIVLWGAVFDLTSAPPAPSLAAQVERIAACLIPAWVMAMCVRVLLVAGHRIVSAVLLFACGASAFAGNVVSLLLSDSGVYTPGGPLDLLWFAAFTTIAAGALHPSMRAMTQPSTRHGALPLARVSVLALSLLAAPVALRIAADVSPSSVPFVGAVLLSALVCWRFIRLVAALGRSRSELHWIAERQTAVSRLSGSALSGQPLEVLTHRALDLVWRHVPARATGGAAPVEVHLTDSASEALRAALPDRPLDAVEAAFVQAIANVLDAAALREHSERAMRHRAVHDQLTGLPNRTLLEERLSAALSRAGRDDSEVAVLFIDLDGFKAVNDSLGHAAGDTMLAEVARRLRTSVRPHDALARFAGDEFVAVIEQTDLADAWRIAERILDALAPTILLPGGNAVTPSASIGLAFARGGTSGTLDPDELIRHADAAMYRAKQRGGARCEIFDEQLLTELRHRRSLERDLRGAAARGELSLVYQPIVRIHGGLGLPTGLAGGAEDVVVGAEALLRWEHPVHGMVPPDEFIPLAEASGLISPVGDWVLSTAIRQLAAWERQLDERAQLMVFVNLSPVQLADPRLLERVRALLEETGATPSRLGIEITESAVLDTGDATTGMVLALRSLGIQVALDDFGTGYSSLTHVRSVPLDLLKVDASFVDRIDSEPGDRAIVAAVAGMARELDVAVLAEGIESAEQLDAVRELGCDLAQGYHLWPPLPPAEVGALLGPGVAGAAGAAGATGAAARPGAPVSAA